MKFFSCFKLNSVTYFFVLIIIFGGYHIFVESPLQGTELINIESYNKHSDEVPFYCSKKINQ